MNRSIAALVISISFALTACAMEIGDPESSLSADEASTEVSYEGMSLELLSDKESGPSTNASCGNWGGWRSNGSSWCGGTGFSCLREGSVGLYTRQSRSRTCCSPPIPCWTEYEYQDALTQCGC